jgi:hypothetical protein
MIHEGRHFLDDFQPIMPINLFEESETAYLSRILNRRSSDHEQKAADHPLLKGGERHSLREDHWRLFRCHQKAGFSN